MKTFEKHINIQNKRLKLLREKAEKYSKFVASVSTKTDYMKHESALAIPLDHSYQKDIAKKIAPLKGAKHIVLIGIGGSSLGTEAVYAALAFTTSPSLLVLDAIDSEALTKLESLIETLDSSSSLALVVVSKSGTTTETLVNGVRALEICEKKFGKDIAKRTVFVGTKGTEFWNIGKKKKVICVSFPEAIGGRYSVFSAVGIVPLTLLGIDVVSFCEGATLALSREYRKQTVEHAVSLALLGEEGVHTVNFFTFNERLKLLGYWYRQLLAESIGKTMTTNGATFCHQLLPTVATSVDLHSMAQLYLGGYRGMYTHFVYANVEGGHHALSDHWLLDHVHILKKKTPQIVQNAIREGVLRAYDDQKLPYRFTTLEKITAHELGLMMASLMFETMCLGHLFDVDVFTQPNVESYKSYTRNILST